MITRNKKRYDKQKDRRLRSSNAESEVSMDKSFGEEVVEAGHGVKTDKSVKNVKDVKEPDNDDFDDFDDDDFFKGCL